MAQASGLSKDHSPNLEAAHLKPHLLETFKLSRDQRFVEKLQDVVGLYLNPPDKALVLCVDEKSQFRPSTALSRSCPQTGSSGPATPRLQRNGTTELVRCAEHAGWDGHWRLPAAASPSRIYPFPAADQRQDTTRSGLASDRDNYGTHKHPRVQSWLKRHPRFHLHFIPTSSSWLNMVERWFREITDKRIRRAPSKTSRI